MSTTKLPEAFEHKVPNEAPSHKHLHALAWADGYNSCLEATGARELWEALQRIADGEVMQGEYALLAIVHEYQRIARAALSKSNPSNTVG